MLTSADLFQTGMVPDTAFNTLTRAAKHVESQRPEAAIQFYKKAANLYKMEGGRIREAADVLARAGCLEIRMSKFGDCITTVERERDLRIEASSMEAAARTNCCLILVQLKRGELEAAKNAHSTGHKIIPGYDNTDGAAIIDDLFSAINNNSLDDFSACIKNPYFRGLENDYVKLIRNLEMPEGFCSDEIDFNDDPSGNPPVTVQNPSENHFEDDEPDFS